MKVLHFRALASSRVAPALMSQVGTTLSPFQRYLRQAIDTAKERQVRYKLPWVRVRGQYVLKLEPLETRLLLPRTPPRWRISNWPADKTPDPGKKLMVANREIMLGVEAFWPEERGLVIQPEAPLEPSDVVWWGGQQCTLERLGSDGPPQGLQDTSGRKLELLHVAPNDDGQSWVVRVRGRLASGKLLHEGVEVDAQLLPALEGIRHLFDSDERALELSGELLKVEELPTAQELRADNGTRFRWKRQDDGRGSGFWLQLQPPENISADEVLDPRAAFCEDDVSEVWTQPRHDPASIVKVKRVDRDRYQLLVEKLPPPGTELYLPVDIRNLQLQRRALRQLAEAPLPHHRGLLRLCEDPEHVQWPVSTPRPPEHWYGLTDSARSGTDQQRLFVTRALASPDFMLLEGPPGSGKTTAICELVQQCLARGERVLVCASTHVAIDNVLERLLDDCVFVDAVRIGNLDRVDVKVQNCQLDTRVESLVSAWRASESFRRYGDEELRQMAERTIIMGANLTCGTTMGIVNHPLFRHQASEVHIAERPIATLPHWDLLIVDEASKTLIQEFLVPALMARRHVVVGDVRQLPPFTDRADLVANLRSLLDDKGSEVFTPDQQRARVLLWRLGNPRLRQPGVRWLLVERAAVLDALEQELAAGPPHDQLVVRVVRTSSHAQGAVQKVSLQELRAGSPRALLLAAAELVLAGEELLEQTAPFLPSTLLAARELTLGERALELSHPFHFQTQAWLSRAAPLRHPIRERRDTLTTLSGLRQYEQAWLSRNDWAGEVTWRLTRIHELKRSKKQKERERYQQELQRLLPVSRDVRPYIEEIQDIGLPSILEVIQEGIGQERARRKSALTRGMRRDRPLDFQARFVSLSWQHRMNPQISTFPRDVIYQNEALLDANTLQLRAEESQWDFAAKLGNRRIWLDVHGQDNKGVNQAEVDEMKQILLSFQRWVKEKGPPHRKRPRRWEVACLCFYVKQERAIREMLQAWLKSDRQTRFDLPDIEIVCGTVDRFQGREADLVLLSMRNTTRTGFLDSPNRLNVAVTRARQQLVILGKASYFRECGIPELEELVTRTQEKKPHQWPGRTG
ncbi:DEAD/DEAH box helicase [Archangium violaceum]|uniref:AAA domain-containing protein n=1 Tax=Archangium violaceum TaxID=83451 RepID=UPI002B2913C7|nr:DEAD/DEAH box helicase [Archangium gephyra]